MKERWFHVLLGTLFIAVIAIVMVSIYYEAASADEAPLTRHEDDNSYMATATYVGSSTCGGCHPDQFTTWNDSMHPKKLRTADPTTVIGDFTVGYITLSPSKVDVDVTVEVYSDGTNYYINLDNDSAPGPNNYTVSHVLGGTGWKQRYVAPIGDSKYILPIQWNIATASWTSGGYNAEDWFNTTTGAPKTIGKDRSWDRRCSGCHATGVELTYNATGTEEWVATYSEPGAGCEACHGPGSEHVAPGSDKQATIWKSVSSTTCGACHTRGEGIGVIGGKTTGFPFNANGETFMPGENLDEYYTLAPGVHDDGNVSRQHHQQYIDYLGHPHSDSLSTIQDSEHGQDFCLDCHSTDYQLAPSDAKPTVATARHDIECSSCHEPHGNALDHDLRMPQEFVCTQCHSTGDTQPGETTHHPQAELVNGTIPIPELSGTQWMGVTCTDCHMPLVAKSAVEYDVASHSFYFISPELSIEHGTPNSCTVTCHQDAATGGALTDAEALEYVNDWKNDTTEKLEMANENLTLAGSALEDASGYGFSAEAVAANNDTYNNSALARDWVDSDGTMAHNPVFSLDVLNYSIEKSQEVVANLTPGKITGTLLDASGNAISGAEIKYDGKVWATTGADGSFEVAIAPGDYTFEVYEDGSLIGSFTAESKSGGQTTSLGDTTMAGASLEDEGMNMLLVGGIVAVVAVAVILALVMMTKKGGKPAPAPEEPVTEEPAVEEAPEEEEPEETSGEEG